MIDVFTWIVLGALISMAVGAYIVFSKRVRFKKLNEQPIGCVLIVVGIDVFIVFGTALLICVVKSL